MALSMVVAPQDDDGDYQLTSDESLGPSFVVRYTRVFAY